MENVFLILIGVVFIVIGIFNSFGYISTLHSYHRKRVSEKDRLPFGRLVGLGMIIIGVSIILQGVLSYITLFNIGVYLIIKYAILIVGFIVGVSFAFYAMIKYNKGIF